MLFSPLPAIEPRDSHTLWHAPSQPYRTHNVPGRPGSRHTQQQQNANTGSRRNTSGNASRNAAGSADPLAALALEERALRVRKQNIASFGFSWIRPAGFPKTMLGIREEELEREEGAAAAAAAVAGQETALDEGDPEQLAALERDLDGDIPDASDEGDGVEDGDGGEEGEGRALVEQGEGDMEEEDEDALMGRDLDNEIPDAFGDDYEDEERDLDDDVPSASENGFDDDDDDDDDEDEEEEREDLEGEGEQSMMARNLDSDIPDPGEEQEWEHTDSDAEVDDDEEEEDDIDIDMDLDDPRRQSRQRLPRQSLPRSSISALPEPIPLLPPQQPRQETEAERLFLERWSDGGSAGFGSSEMMPEPNLRIPRRRTRRYSAQSSSSNSIE